VRPQAAIAVSAFAAALLAAPLAAGAPTSSGPPSISGYPGYMSKLTCKQGSWSADAQSFSYEWLYDPTGPVVATTQTYRPDASKVGHRIACRVTATDGAGEQAAATSPSVLIGRGRTTMTLRAKKVQHKKVTLSGKVGPRAAVVGASVVAYRVEPIGLVQLFGKTTLKPNGNYKIVAPDIPGKHRYKVNFNPRDPSIWLFSHRFAKVNLKRR
jgi:hypothetical protein